MKRDDIRWWWVLISGFTTRRIISKKGARHDTRGKKRGILEDGFAGSKEMKRALETTMVGGDSSKHHHGSC